MACYWIASANITDLDEYRKYIERAPVALARFGGRVLVRGGERLVLEGSNVGERVAVLEFPSREHALGFYNSPEYQEAKQFRIHAGDVKALFLVDGV